MYSLLTPFVYEGIVQSTRESDRMTRSLCARLVVPEGEIYTGGSELTATLTLDVHRTEISLGSTVLELRCEERALSKPRSTIVQHKKMDHIPAVLGKGTHNFTVALKILDVIDNYPSLMIASNSKMMVGVYWILEVTFGDFRGLNAFALVPVYPARTLESGIWKGKLEESDTDQTSTDVSYRGPQRRTQKTDTTLIAYEELMRPRQINGYSTGNSNGCDVIGMNHHHASNEAHVENAAHPSNEENDGQILVRKPFRPSDENDHGPQVHPDQSSSLHTANPTLTVGPHKPRRSQRVGTKYKIITSQIPFIVSNLEERERTRARSKILTLLFGEKYRNPRKEDLVEIQVRANLYVPKWGLFQSPHKSGFRLHVRADKGDAVILSQVLVKFIANTMVKSIPGQIYRQSTTIFEENIGCPLIKGEVDLSEELSDLEIPTVCETTETDLLAHWHQVRVTLVLRSLHMYNMSRWLTLESPVNVLPGIIKMPEERRTGPPPSYDG